MKVRLRKISHTQFELSTESGGNSTAHILDTKTFLKHDMTHRAIELQLESDSYSALEYDTETERLAGVLHDMKEGELPEDRLHGIRNMWSAHNEEIPKYITIDFIKAVQTKYINIYNAYQFLKTGENIEI
jgi:hypothetical protein